MNHHSDSLHHTSHDRPAASRRGEDLHATRGRFPVGELIRGALLGGAAYLLGSCPLVLGAAPLGLALACAATSYTWYILAGLILSALLHPVTLHTWAWVGVYAFCLCLRLVIRFFIDPPVSEDGRPLRGMAYLTACWASFKKNVGLLTADGSATDNVSEEDYYAGAENPTFHPNAAPKRESASVREDTVPSAGMQLFGEHPLLRLLTATVCGFAAGVFGMVAGGFHVYDLLATFFYLVATPVATFLLLSCFGDAGLLLLFSPRPLREGRNDGVLAQFHLLPLLSVTFLLTACVFAARRFSVMLGTPYLTVQAALMLALLLTLLACSRLGFVPGVAVALCCGLAASPLLSPLFILSATGYSLLQRLSHRGGIIGGCTVGLFWCATASGMLTAASLLPTLLVTVPLYFVCEKLTAVLPAPLRRAHEVAPDFTVAVACETRVDAQRNRLRALSEAFTALSQKFYSLSSQLKRPRMLDLRRICDESFAQKCANCRDRDICWGSEYDRTLEVQTRLAAQLHTKGKADSATLPASLQDFCPHMKSIVTDINTRCARMTEALLKSEKTEVFAADYEAMAALLSDALEEDGEEYRCNRAAADRIFEYLTAEGIGVQGVVVCGRRQCRVIVRGVRFGDTADKIGAIRAAIEDICGSRLSEPTFEVGEDHTVMILASEPDLDATYSGSTVAAGTKEGDELPPPLTDATPPDTYRAPDTCGDHIALFKTDNAYFYALISDGMGSGENASLTSDVCTMFLEKMLTAGNRVEISLRMLNSFIRSKNTGTGDECTATVDLMEMDLIGGQAVFAKSGAAPTYVVRDGTVYKLRSRTLPLGILRDSAPQLLRFRMHPGDVVVMVSDGVTHGNDECPWLIDLLSSPMPDSMDNLRSDIIRRAIASGSPDDLSAIAVRVEEASGHQSTP